MGPLRFLASVVVATALLAPRPAPAHDRGDGTAALLADVNAARAAAGVAALSANARLACAAEAHARDLAARGRLDHVGSDGADLTLRLDRVGYRFVHAAENLALAGADPAEVVSLWRSSPGHRRNMLDRAVTDAGIGVARAGGQVYWVLDLGRRRGKPGKKPRFPGVLANCLANPG